MTTSGTGAIENAVSTAEEVLAALDEALAAQWLPPYDELRRELPDDVDALHAVTRRNLACRLLDEEIARWRERSYLHRESGRIMEQRALRAVEDGDDLVARAAFEEVDASRERGLEAEATLKELERLRTEIAE